MKTLTTHSLLGLLLVIVISQSAKAQSPETLWRHYFEQQVLAIESQSSESPSSESDRERLLDQLGLNPLPPRTPLQTQITGSIERNGVIVERIQFQSRPGLYVTANLYRPESQVGPLPGLLYLCGHGAVHRNGISYGNKVHYRHHGEWAARLGFVCLVIDSLQLGEIEGIHHGTHRYDRWWWVTRGYTPAGVEAWNCLRAVDYLAARSEVDSERIGCTGRSGGGAYSWWIAAIDSRIQCAAPVAGMTDLRDHVVLGCVSGHCDCMYPINLDRWDFPRIAALVAPRPLLLINTDRDPIFPLGGVLRTHQHLTQQYRRFDAESQLGLAVLPGEHVDTQELQLAAFRWLRRHLADSTEPISLPSQVSFTPDDLKVLSEPPADAINNSIDQHFITQADPAIPTDERNQLEAIQRWRKSVNTHVFARHHQTPPSAKLLQQTSSGDGWTIQQFQTTAPLVVQAALRQPPIPTHQWRVIITHDLHATLEHLKEQPPATQENWAIIEPRGSGPTALPTDPTLRIHHHRRLHLIGETLDLGRLEDLRSVLNAVLQEGSHDAAEPPLLKSPELTLQGSGVDAWLCVAAAVLEPQVQHLKLTNVSSTPEQFPVWMAFDRFLTPQQLLILAAENCISLELSQTEVELTLPIKQWAEQRHWPEHRLRLHPDANQP